MALKLMLFCILMISGALADDGEKDLNGYDPKVDMISEDYEAGPFLIYDCAKKHYVCVLESYSKECEEKRLKDLALNKENVSCTPISEHLNKKSCFQNQLLLVSRNHGTRGCVAREWKQKEIDF
jgi:hypothetical protein